MLDKKIDQSQNSESALDPISRISEILFGLIMVLTFTCSLSAAEVGREDVKEMLVGAIGCNLAWGIIDALMFLMAAITSRGRTRHLITQLKTISDPAVSRKLVADALPSDLAGILENQHLDFIKERAIKEGDARIPAGFTWTDIKGALQVFALVFFSILPVVIPFIFLRDPYQALRISNLIAVVMLFWLGRILGIYAGRSPLIWGIVMAVIGTSLVSVTIALGG